MGDPLDETRQLVVHPAFWDRLVTWIRGQGLDVGQIPVEGEDLPTYIITIPFELPPERPSAAEQVERQVSVHWAIIHNGHRIPSPTCPICNPDLRHNPLVAKPST